MSATQDDIFTLLQGAPVVKPHPTLVPVKPAPASAKTLDWDAVPKATNATEFYQNYHPTLIDIVEYAANYYNKEAERYEPLIGETETLCTAWIAYVAAQIGAIIRSYPGTGKSATANPIFDSIPDEYKYRILNLSGKGIWYAVEDLKRALYVYFGEWQKAAQNEDVVEIVKDWGEGRAATRERADITASASSGTDQTKKTVIPRRPILVTVASADGKDDESLNEQVLRRYPEVPTDPSRGQTEAVIAMKGGLWDPESEGYVLTMTEPDKERFRNHVRFMIENAPKDAVFPGGKVVLSQTMPSDYPISRSMADIFKKVVNGVARFHHYDRMTWTNKAGEEVLVVTPADFWLARRIYGNVLLLNCLRISAMGREVLEVLPKITTRNQNGQFVATHNEKLTVSEIREALKARGLSLEKAKVSHELTSLLFNSYVECDDTEPKRYYRSSTTANLDQHMTPELMRSLVEEIKAAAMKYDFGQEYVKRFCTNPIMVKDPLTGDTLNILEDLPREPRKNAPIIVDTKGSAEKTVVKAAEKQLRNPANAKGSGLYAFDK